MLQSVCWGKPWPLLLLSESVRLQSICFERTSALKHLLYSQPFEPFDRSSGGKHLLSRLKVSQQSYSGFLKTHFCLWETQGEYGCCFTFSQTVVGLKIQQSKWSCLLIRAISPILAGLFFSILWHIVTHLGSIWGQWTISKQVIAGSVVSFINV